MIVVPLAPEHGLRPSQDEVWQRDTNQDVCHWRVWREELKRRDFRALGASGGTGPGKNFPVIGNRCSLGGLEGVFPMQEGFKRVPHRSSPAPVLDRFFAVEPELQTKMRSVGLR